MASSSASGPFTPFISRAKRTFFLTVSQGKRAYCWNTTPRSVPVPCTSLPSQWTSPLVGSSRPAMMFRRVLLPQPEGPTTQMNSLSWMSSVTPLRAIISPLRPLNFLTTLSTCTFTGAPSM